MYKNLFQELTNNKNNAIETFCEQINSLNQRQKIVEYINFVCNEVQHIPIDSVITANKLAHILDKNNILIMNARESINNMETKKMTLHMFKTRYGNDVYNFINEL